MSFRIIRADITTLGVDAIVNAANTSLLGGGGVDGAIHRAAGPRLLEECRTLGGCAVGQAKITNGYDLKAKYVIHTVGPVWNGGNHGEKDALSSCYKESLELAKAYKLSSVAFPLISAGAYGYPKDQAIAVARNSIKTFLDNNDDFEITLVIYDKSSFEISKSLDVQIEEYIRENEIVPPSQNRQYQGRSFSLFKEAKANLREESDGLFSAASVGSAPCAPYPLTAPLGTEREPATLKDMLDRVDESFSDALFRIIDSKGLKDPEVYKKANVDRKHFSKIRSDSKYRPSKTTALALAIALELDLDETEALLKKAGYALSHSYKSDIIIEFFIKNKKYDIFEINEALFKYDQALLGA